MPDHDPTRTPSARLSGHRLNGAAFEAEVFGHARRERIEHVGRMNAALSGEKGAKALAFFGRCHGVVLIYAQYRGAHSAMAGTAIDLIDCTRVNMKRHNMSLFGDVIARLLLLAVLGFASAAAVPQELDPGQQGRAEPEPSRSVPPGPDQPDGGQNPHNDTNPEPALPASTSASICLMVESAAQAHGLPFEFFARLIWQESRFKPNAVGPMTRRGQRAEGIAQFMPGTASERGLFDPFDPVSALPKSAEFLEELHATFGNLGLAAAAYNAGPRRVRDWLDGRGGLPAETRNYVLKITGRSAEEWAAASRSGGGDKAPLPKGNCR